MMNKLFYSFLVNYGFVRLINQYWKIFYMHLENFKKLIEDKTILIFDEFLKSEVGRRFI